MEDALKNREVSRPSYPTCEAELEEFEQWEEELHAPLITPDDLASMEIEELLGRQATRLRAIAQERETQ